MKQATSSNWGIIYLSLILLGTLVSGIQSQTDSCYVFGSQHVYTYDHQIIDFNSDLQFVISEARTGAVTPFKISIINEYKYHNVDSASRVYCVEVVYSPYTARICADQTAMINNEEVARSLSIQGLLIYYGTRGREIAISVGTTLIRVSITSSSTVTVTLPTSYKGKVGGLCGNYNGDAADDLYLKGGTPVPDGTDKYKRGALIAASYLAPDFKSLPVEPFYPSSCYILADEESIISQTDMCGIYEGSATPAFIDCYNKMPTLAAKFFDVCRYDYCENYLVSSPSENTTSACENNNCVRDDAAAKASLNAITEVFVDICKKQESTINTDWRTEYDAPLSCTGGATQVADGPYCPSVCGVHSTCRDTGLDGCACGSLESKEGNVCIPSNQCGCSDITTGDYYKIDEWWLGGLCTLNYTCVRSNTVSVVMLTCDENSVCTSTGCVCDQDKGFVGDGLFCERNCPPGEQALTQRECLLCPIGSYKETEGTGLCTSCPRGQITSEEGSMSSSDCYAIKMAPESSIPQSYTGAADTSFYFRVPNTLSQGLPFGSTTYRDVWISTAGVVSFGDYYVGTQPRNLEWATKPMLAPFWFRQDLRVPSGRFARAISPVTNNEVEVTVSTFDKSASGSIAAQMEAVTALDQISILLESSDKVQPSFKPSFAMVINWKNTVPYPAFLYYNDESLWYQCTIVTDGRKTYAMYIYPMGGLVLAISRRQSRFIYMGFNAQDASGTKKFNFFKSGTAAMTELDREPSNTLVPGRWVFEVASGIVNPNIPLCINWALRVASYIGFIPARPCPCNKRSALSDDRFFYDFDEDCAYATFRQWSFFGPFLVQGGYQKCCYEFYGPLITEPKRAGYPLSFSKFNFREYLLYFSEDYLPFLQCCKMSGLCALYRFWRPVQDCTGYRPPRIAGGFGDPHIYTLDGDLYTYNPIGEFWMIKSANFSMQARMVQTTSDSNTTIDATQFGAFVMQDSLGGNLSDIVHVEANSETSVIEVRVNGELINSQITTEAPVLNGNGVSIKLFNESYTVSFNSGFSIRISLRFGILSQQSLVPETAIGTIDGLVGHYDGNSTNDFQDRNGNIVCTGGEINNDCTPKIIHEQFGESWRVTEEESLFWYRPGFDTNSYTDLNFEPLTPDFSNSSIDLSICNDNMQCMFDLFMTNDTAIGADTANTEAEVKDKALTFGAEVPFLSGPSDIEAIVGTTVSATYYTNYTGNDTVIIYALSSPALSTFEEVGNTNEYLFTWTPTDLSVQKIQFIASIVDDMGMNVSVSPILEVFVKLSDSCINGEPSYNTTAVDGALSATFTLVTCQCDPGYVGDVCQTDYDGCEDNLCDEGTCVDVNATDFDPVIGRTYTCNIVTCQPGYNRKIYDGVQDEFCSDIDECLSNTTVTCTNTICQNTLGSYFCVCERGFVFETDSNTTCLNIDECDEGVAQCQQQCTDTEGSYNCSCNAGFVLNDDGMSCTAENATDTTSSSTTSTTSTTMSPVTQCEALNCSYSCNVTSNLCICPRGQELDADKKTCKFINECNGVTVCDTSTNSTCHDLDVGYECKCPEIGYKELVNNNDPCIPCDFGNYGSQCGETCLCGDRARKCDNKDGCVDCNPGWKGEQCAVDINECIGTASLCGPLAKCENTNGSFICLCPDGYQNKNSTHCDDIDECTTVAPCSKLAKCDNTEGGFNCTCQSGFTGDGIRCSDVNECFPDSGVSPCVPNLALCKNEFGGFRCDCNIGYIGDGTVAGTGCVNDNECLATNACQIPQSTCVDTPGSFTCPCKPGFEEDNTGTACIDIDECTLKTFNCTEYETSNGAATCNNTDGGYTCDTACDEGYTKTPVNSTEFFTCEQTNECMADIFPCNNDTETCEDVDGSYQCNCRIGYDKAEANETCSNIDECLNITCPTIVNGQSRCEDTVGSYTCVETCDLGYTAVIGSNGVTTCANVDECEMGYCDELSQNCADTDGSYTCSCKDGFQETTHGSNCTNINECLDASSCGNGSYVCVDLIGSFNCSCWFGWTGENCDTKIAGVELIKIEQVLGGLEFNPDWTDSTSPARLVFNSLMSAALAPMYSSTASFIGVNILEVLEFSNKKRAISDVQINYDAVFGEAVDESDVIHRALDYLISTKYMLTYNDSSIADKLMLAYPGVFDNGAVTCETEITVNGKVEKLIDCQGRGTCEHVKGTDYPMCVCDIEYDGYNCNEDTGVTQRPETNLLALWISVAVAGALLVGGLLACTMVMVYQRRKRSRPKLHRHATPFSGGARGPAIFNPTSRLPTEAFNYQFPVGSVRDDLSDSSSTVSSATTRTQRTEGRVGSTVPFAPRWPRAYYAQLGDPDDN